MGMGEENVSVIGVPSVAVKGAAGGKSDRAMRGITDKAAGVDPLVAAWAVSGITVGADSSVANGADFVDPAVVKETEIVGTTVVASVESPLGTNGLGHSDHGESHPKLCGKVESSSEAVSRSPSSMHEPHLQQGQGGRPPMGGSPASDGAAS
ncbi:hypothetical protein DKX38_029371 [Salix brachista]|uniref:Uncharacterized protein n=1 Tax=Salix brachista TaxID=2182728 RepID=A0A5N5J4S3_9ROSI|nr:hypothetical protein DKX38_029371 [Salix brachista]